MRKPTRINLPTSLGKPKAMVIAIMNFEDLSTGEAANKTSQEERQARYQRMIAVAKTRHKLAGISRQYRPRPALRFGQSDALPGEEEA